MFKIVAVLLGFAGFGGLLASGVLPLPVRAGYLGGALLVGCAWVATLHWERRAHTSGDEPNISERRAWLLLAGTALIAGFVLWVLATPGSEVHRRTGDTGGFDSWAMLAGAAIGWALVNATNRARDERDLAIDAAANRVGYTALVSLLVVFLLALGFAPKPSMARFTHWLIANSLLSLIMWATLAQHMAALRLYAKDRQANRAIPASPEAAP